MTTSIVLLLALQQVTVDLDGVSFEDAAERVLTPFGMNTDWVRSSLQPPNLVHLRLENAFFWKAADELCDAAGVPPIRTPKHPLVARGFCGSGPEYERIVSKDFGPARVTGVLGTDHQPPGPVHVQLYCLFPPGRPPARLELRGFAVRDASGRTFPVAAAGPVQRSTDDPSAIPFGVGPRLTMPWKEVRPPLTLSGALVPTYADGTSNSIPFELDAAPDWKAPAERATWVLWIGGGSLLLLLAASAGLLLLSSTRVPSRPTPPGGVAER